MNKNYQLQIARLVHKEIDDVISKWQSNKDIYILCFWNGTISIDGQIFENHELN